MRGDLLAELRAQLVRYDDEALAALANRGLLRRARKDLQSCAAVVEAGAEQVAVSIGERRVSFDARGPAHASCTCRASAVCQHILAACLFLKEGAGDAPVAYPEALHREMMTFGAKELQAWAGKAALRWATQFVADRAEVGAPAISREPHITIEFRHPRLSFRYMGGGLDSVVTDYSGREPKKHVVAAVLAYQRAHGAELPQPETERPQSGGLDLGKDHALPEGGSVALATLRREVLSAAEKLLGECVDIGLSHLSEAIHQRLTTISVSAQGAELFRLGLALRRLADHTDWLLERQGGADEAQMLTELARTYALVQAVRAAESAGRLPRLLVGEARSRYDALPRLQLIGLASWPWRARSGYHGLTSLFWAPQEKSWFTFTDARPVAQPGFDPVARYKGPGPWPGASSPGQLHGKRFVLQNAEANPAGRLSSTQKSLAGELAEADPALLNMPAVTDWSRINELARNATGRGLAPPDPRAAYLVLAPSGTRRATFDPTAQRLHWPLFDGAEKDLILELDFSELNASAVACIEALPAQSNASDLRVVAAVRPVGGRLRLEPLSLLRVDKALSVTALHFDAAKSSPIAAAWHKLAQLMGSGKPIAEPAVANLPAVLVDLRAALRSAAERGMRAGAAVDDAIQGSITRCAGAGLSVFKQIAGCATGAERLLRLSYAADELALALGGDPGEDFKPA